MFISDENFRQALADTLKVGVEKLAQYWDRLCKQAHESSYRDIRGALIARGFSPSQVDVWDRGEEYERDIGLYYCLVRGIGMHSYPLDLLVMLDRRKELQTVHVEVSSGAPQEPLGSPAKFARGDLNTTDDAWTKDMTL